MRYLLSKSYNFHLTKGVDMRKSTICVLMLSLVFLTSSFAIPFDDPVQDSPEITKLIGGEVFATADDFIPQIGINVDANYEEKTNLTLYQETGIDRAVLAVCTFHTGKIERVISPLHRQYQTLRIVYIQEFRQHGIGKVV